VRPQDSTGRKQKLGPIAVLRRAQENPGKYPWLTQLLARRPFKVVAVAPANKMARTAWALMVRGGTYRRRSLLKLAQSGSARKRRGDARAFTNCRDDEDIDAKRSRPSIGKPVMGHGKKERVLLFGTDQRITSGPAAKRPRSKAEYMTAPERFADSQIPLAPRAPSIHGPSARDLVLLADARLVLEPNFYGLDID
jgi:hypothetical protein